MGSTAITMLHALLCTTIALFLPGDTHAALTGKQLAVVVNESDSDSREIGRYYQAKRNLPDANIIRVRFPPGGTTMSREVFRCVRAVLDDRTPAGVQAYALAWTTPYRVACMSITTAFAAGFDESFCAKDCRPTRLSPYFNSDSAAPYTDFRLRPAMALAGRNLAEVKKLIDRGVSADATFPAGTGYLVNTSDPARNVRAAIYPAVIHGLAGRIRLQQVNADEIQNRNDVLFYFTGAKHVAALTTNTFLPGAVADHLTSAGGALTAAGDQMSSLRWLEAGATGSYGAVVEPCNITAKFPSPGIAMRRYLDGETLIEAYWKSVAMPGQGLFIGEPLATPFRRQTFSGGQK